MTLDEASSLCRGRSLRRCTSMARPRGLQAAWWGRRAAGREGTLTLLRVSRHERQRAERCAVTAVQPAPLPVSLLPPWAASVWRPRSPWRCGWVGAVGARPRRRFLCLCRLSARGSPGTPCLARASVAPSAAPAPHWSCTGQALVMPGHAWSCLVTPGHAWSCPGHGARRAREQARNHNSLPASPSPSPPWSAWPAPVKEDVHCAPQAQPPPHLLTAPKAVRSWCRIFVVRELGVHRLRMVRMRWSRSASSSCGGVSASCSVCASTRETLSSLIT